MVALGEVKLTEKGMRYIVLFENLTGAVAVDCIVDENGEDERIVFVTKKGDMGLAIGKGGANINRIKDAIGKRIKLIEYSDDVVEFIDNAFRPIPLKSVNIIQKNNRRLAYIQVRSTDKGLAIGRNGRNIQIAKVLVQRHHNLDDLIIQ